MEFKLELKNSRLDGIFKILYNCRGEELRTINRNLKTRSNPYNTADVTTVQLMTGNQQLKLTIYRIKPQKLKSNQPSCCSNIKEQPQIGEKDYD